MAIQPQALLRRPRWKSRGSPCAGGAVVEHSPSATDLLRDEMQCVNTDYAWDGTKLSTAIDPEPWNAFTGLTSDGRPSATATGIRSPRGGSPTCHRGGALDRTGGRRN